MSGGPTAALKINIGELSMKRIVIFIIAVVLTFQSLTCNVYAVAEGAVFAFDMIANQVLNYTVDVVGISMGQKAILTSDINALDDIIEIGGLTNSDVGIIQRARDDILEGSILSDSDKKEVYSLCANALKSWYYVKYGDRFTFDEAMILSMSSDTFVNDTERHFWETLRDAYNSSPAPSSVEIVDDTVSMRYSVFSDLNNNAIKKIVGTDVIVGGYVPELDFDYSYCSIISGSNSVQAFEELGIAYFCGDLFTNLEVPESLMKGTNVTSFLVPFAIINDKVYTSRNAIVDTGAAYYHDSYLACYMNSPLWAKYTTTGSAVNSRGDGKLLLSITDNNGNLVHNLTTVCYGKSSELLEEDTCSLCFAEFVGEDASADLLYNTDSANHFWYNINDYNDRLTNAEILTADIQLSGYYEAAYSDVFTKITDGTLSDEYTTEKEDVFVFPTTVADDVIKAAAKKAEVEVATVDPVISFSPDGIAVGGVPLPKTDDDDTPFVYVPAVPGINTGELDLSIPGELDKQMKVETDIPDIFLDKFPFSLPFDLYHILTLFVYPEKEPIFEVPIKTTLQNGGFEFEIDETIVLDLTVFKINGVDIVKVVLNFASVVGFTIMLIKTTTKFFV